MEDRTQLHDTLPGHQQANEQGMTNAPLLQETGGTSVVSAMRDVIEETAEFSLQDYRRQLIEAEHDQQSQYDKTTLTLAGGAFGISFIFLKDIVGSAPEYLPFLFASWLFWASSLATVLLSFFFSQRALRHAVRQLDEDRIYEESPGGFLDLTTAGLNLASGTAFILGLICMIVFAGLNL